MKKSELGAFTDTLTVYDTIPYLKPIPRDSVVIRYITKTLPQSVKTDKYVPKANDTIPQEREPVLKDSVYVQIPITQKRYETDTYRAYVSGYNPSLDSLIFRQPTQVIYKKSKPKRWSVGIQAGYGLSLSKTPQFHPYIGIGVSYNLFSF